MAEARNKPRERNNVGMIQSKRPLQGPESLVPVNTSIGTAQMVLVIEANDALGFLDLAPHRQSVVLTQKRMLSARMLQTIQPDAIIGPLISAEWDIVDLALTLESMGYCGALYAVTRPLPRAELVVREVAAVCPGLSVHLLETG